LAVTCPRIEVLATAELLYENLLALFETDNFGRHLGTSKRRLPEFQACVSTDS
jgi:hypothetical protein